MGVLTTILTSCRQHLGKHIIACLQLNKVNCVALVKYKALRNTAAIGRESMLSRYHLDICFNDAYKMNDLVLVVSMV